MKYCLMAMICSIGLLAQAQQNLIKTIDVSGQSRTYRMYVPANYNGSMKVPLIFNFHGYTSNAQEQELYGDFRAIADTAGFILIHPEGSDRGGGQLGWENFSTPGAVNQDFLFVEAMLDSLLSTWEIDPDRIYSTGMSNGGFMSYDLACFMSHRFAAIASVTGSMVNSHLSACQPEFVLPVMQIHGTNDATVGYNGASWLVNSVPIEDLVGFWANRHQCVASAQMTNVPNISNQDLSTAEHYVYSNTQGEPVEFYKIINGGHTWPGSAIQIPGLVTNMDFSASKEIWRFFSQHSRQDLLKTDMASQTNFNISQQNEVIQINSSQFIKAQVKIYDLLGKSSVQKEWDGLECNVEMSGLNRGIYILNVSNEAGEQLYTTKVYW